MNTLNIFIISIFLIVMLFLSTIVAESTLSEPLSTEAQVSNLQSASTTDVNSPSTGATTESQSEAQSTFKEQSSTAEIVTSLVSVRETSDQVAEITSTIEPGITISEDLSSTGTQRITSLPESQSTVSENTEFTSAGESAISRSESSISVEDNSSTAKPSSSHSITSEYVSASSENPTAVSEVRTTIEATSDRGTLTNSGEANEVSSTESHKSQSTAEMETSQWNVTSVTLASIAIESSTVKDDQVSDQTNTEGIDMSSETENFQTMTDSTSTDVGSSGDAGTISSTLVSMATSERSGTVDASSQTSTSDFTSISERSSTRVDNSSTSEKQPQSQSTSTPSSDAPLWSVTSDDKPTYLSEIHSSTFVSYEEASSSKSKADSDMSSVTSEGAGPTHTPPAGTTDNAGVTNETIYYSASDAPTVKLTTYTEDDNISTISATAKPVTPTQLVTSQQTTEVATTRAPGSPGAPPLSGVAFIQIPFSLLLIMGWMDELDNPESGEYKELHEDANNKISSVYSQAAWFNGMKIQRFKPFERDDESTPNRRRNRLSTEDVPDNSTLIDYTVSVDASSSLRQVQNDVKNTIAKGLGGLNIFQARVHPEYTENSTAGAIDDYIARLSIDPSPLCDVIDDSKACSPCTQCRYSNDTQQGRCKEECTEGRLCLHEPDQPPSGPWIAHCSCPAGYIDISDDCVLEDLIIGLSVGIGLAIILALIIMVVVLARRNKAARKSPRLMLTDDAAIETATFLKDNTYTRDPAHRSRRSSDNIELEDIEVQPAAGQKNQPSKYAYKNPGLTLDDEEVGNETIKNNFKDFKPNLEAIDTNKSYVIQRPTLSVQTTVVNVSGKVYERNYF